MTRKDYELIAAVISDLRATVSVEMPGAYDEALQDVAIQLADELRQTNPRFDGERFLRACRA